MVMGIVMAVASVGRGSLIWSCSRGCKALSGLVIERLEGVLLL